MQPGRREQMAEALAQYINNPQPGTVAEILDPHQAGVIRAVSESWLRGNVGRVKEPTGGGKTVMQAALVDATRTRTLVVVPRLFLLQQTTAEIANRVPDVSVTPYHGGRKDLRGQVNITTYPSFVRGVARGDIDPAIYDLVLYDEAHHLLPTRRVQTSKFFNGALQVGFTATPAYGKNRHLREVLTHEISNTSIRQGVESNRLCSFSVFMVQTGINLDQVKVKERNGEKEFDDVWLQKAVNVAERNKAAVDLYKQSFDGKQSVAFCAGVDHARALAENFNNAGVKALAVSGSDSPKLRDEKIRRYKAGEVQVLCNADLLIEGLDDVKTSVILNLRPTLSPRLAEQRGGRALRLDREDRGKYAYIVDFIDDVPGKNQPVSFAQVAEAAQIVNTWYERKPGEYIGYLKPVILDLKKAKVITDRREVMWAVNELSGMDFEIEEGWKTLRRISAETGVPLEVLRAVEKQTEGALWDLREDEKLGGGHYVKDFTSPSGNKVIHYYYNAIASLLHDVLYYRGYNINQLNVSEETPQNLYLFDPSIFVGLDSEGRRLARKLKNVDIDHLLQYVFDVYEKILGRDDKLYGKETTNQIEAFKREIAKADGSLIPLKRMTPDDKKLFIQARYFDIPEVEDDNIEFTEDFRAEREFFGMQRLLLVDIYSEEKDGLSPVAHLDWSDITDEQLLKGAVSARSNMHQFVKPKNEHERLARERWSSGPNPGFSSKVEEKYRRLGLGSLMLATSGVALEAKGFSEFTSGALTETEARVYDKFNFLAAKISRSVTAPIEQLTNNPQADLAIEKYVL